MSAVKTENTILFHVLCTDRIVILNITIQDAMPSAIKINLNISVYSIIHIMPKSNTDMYETTNMNVPEVNSEVIAVDYTKKCLSENPVRPSFCVAMACQ
jgi:hypothetical protein